MSSAVCAARRPKGLPISRRISRPSLGVGVIVIVAIAVVVGRCSTCAAAPIDRSIANATAAATAAAPSRFGGAPLPPLASPTRAGSEKWRVVRAELAARAITNDAECGARQWRWRRRRRRLLFAAAAWRAHSRRRRRQQRRRRE